MASDRPLGITITGLDAFFSIGHIRTSLATTQQQSHTSHLIQTQADFANEINVFSYWMRQLPPARDEGAQATKIQRRYRRNRWTWRRLRKQYRGALSKTDAHLFPGMERIIEQLVPVCMMRGQQEDQGQVLVVATLGLPGEGRLLALSEDWVSEQTTIRLFRSSSRVLLTNCAVRG